MQLLLLHPCISLLQKLLSKRTYHKGLTSASTCQLDVCSTSLVSPGRFSLRHNAGV